MNVSINFKPLASLRECIDCFESDYCSDLVVWYIGPKGLRKETVNFYREKVFTPLLKKHSTTKIWLLDISSWHQLSKDKNNTFKESRHANHLNSLNDNTVKCIESSKFLNKIKNPSDSTMDDFLKKILNRSEIYLFSKKYAKIGRSIQDIFGTNNGITNNIKQMDISKAYSAIQYLELFFILEQIIANSSTTSNVKIGFLIPNSEFEYYSSSQAFLKTEVMEFLSLLTNKTFDSLDIFFYPFLFGNNLRERPYNLPGEKIKPTLNIHNVIGELR